MQIDLSVAMIIAVQVGTTTALGMILKMVINRLDKQNGSITKTMDKLNTHIADRALHK